MPDQTVTLARPTSARPWFRTARWVASFVGFPLGGLAASIIVGPADTSVAAAAGGLITGAVLGAAQAAGLGLTGKQFVHWIAATAVGLGAGLGIGATAVGFGTAMQDLLIQGAITGLAVGAAQAVVLRSRLGAAAWGWPPALAALWTLGWFLTTSVGVQVDQHWTVFGAAGAITVTVLTSVLPAVYHRQAQSTTLRSAS